MDHLKTYSKLWTLTALLVLLFLIAFTVIKEIKVDDLLNIQFSNNFDEFKSLVTKSNRSIEVLRSNTYFDFAFIVAYTLLFFMSVKVFDFTLELKLFKWYYVFCVLPGILDVYENVSVLHMLNQLNVDGSSRFTYFFWSVRLKWGLIIPFFIMTFTIILFYLTLWTKILINRLLY